MDYLIPGRCACVYITQSSSNSAQSTAASLPWSVQNFTTIRSSKWMLWTNEVSRDLGLRWVSGRLPYCTSPLAVLVTNNKTSRAWASKFVIWIGKNGAQYATEQYLIARYTPPQVNGSTLYSKPTIRRRLQHYHWHCLTDYLIWHKRVGGCVSLPNHEINTSTFLFSTSVLPRRQGCDYLFIFIFSTVEPVYNDHLMGYFSVFWSSSGWPKAN